MLKPLKLTLLRLGLGVMTLAQIASCNTSHGVAQLRFLPPSQGVLRLTAGQPYQAAADGEVWYSASKYQALELQLIDALGALKQAQNK